MTATSNRFKFDSAQEWDWIEVWIYGNPNYIVVLFHRNSQTYILCNIYNSVYIDITDVHSIVVDGNQRAWLKSTIFNKQENAQIQRVQTLSEVKEILKYQLTLALL